MQGSLLQGLAVTDADQVAAHLPWSHPEVLTYPVDLVGIDLQCPAHKTGMLMPLPNINGIGRNGGIEDKYRLAVPSDVQALALADGVVLGTDVIFLPSLSR